MSKNKEMLKDITSKLDNYMVCFIEERANAKTTIAFFLDYYELFRINPALAQLYYTEYHYHVEKRALGKKVEHDNCKYTSKIPHRLKLAR